jgi:rubrerythrin
VRGAGAPARAAGGRRPVREGGQAGVLRDFAEQALDLGLVSTEAENLHLAIEEEAYQADTMYREFAAQAGAAGDHAAAQRFQRLAQYERRNRDEFLTTLRGLDPPDPAE